ncbi:MAG: LPS export ABC transporter periplasmic protein LptC [Rhodoferax sp.]
MKLLRDAWDRFLLYLPLAVMGVLALGTYWMVRSTPVIGEPAARRPPSHDPDYFMHGFSVRTFDPAGQVRTEVQGREARHYPDTRLLEIDGIQIRSRDPQGHLTIASANRGLTNEDHSEVQLLGNAVVVREAYATGTPHAVARMEYRGEFLHAFFKTEKVRSHKPVELLRGQDRFSADTLDFDNVEQVLHLRGRVRGTLVPEAR